MISALRANSGNPDAGCAPADAAAGQPLWVDVVCDDVEAGTQHVSRHRQPHVADPDDPDHLLPFFRQALVSKT